MESSDSPMEARRLRSSRMLRPASTRIRVFSVARRAALPELPLASTQNFTIVLLPEHSEYTQSHGNRIRDICFGYWDATVSPW